MASMTMAQPIGVFAWKLTVYLHPAFGVDKVYVEEYELFGTTQGDWFTTGVGAYATLWLRESEFPSGYYYKICVGTGFLGSWLSTWFTTTSTGGDQVYNYVYSDGTEHLYTLQTQTQTEQQNLPQALQKQQQNGTGH